MNSAHMTSRTSSRAWRKISEDQATSASLMISPLCPIGFCCSLHPITSSPIHGKHDTLEELIWEKLFKKVPIHLISIRLLRYRRNALLLKITEYEAAGAASSSRTRENFDVQTQRSWSCQIPIGTWPEIVADDSVRKCAIDGWKKLWRDRGHIYLLGDLE